ncbi:tyrosine-type recombinase/integrase [Mycolicibacterium wolinskyi]|nr:tyrosine-type recombinase/integrase [Mycolicibacterium wolinskyi]
MDFDPGKGKMLFREAAQIWLESRVDMKNASNHRYALAPAATRRGDGKTLGIDAVFGGYPLNQITRTYIQEWVNQLTAAGKKPSTVRHAFWTVRMVLEQAVVDGRLAVSPAQYVKLPTERGANGGKIGVVDRTQFLTAAQVSALVAATPWPYNVYVHLAAWSGLRAAELGGLQIQDVELPANRHATLRVERAVRFGADDRGIEPADRYGPTKTTGSLRRVPLPPHTTALVRDYVAMHPRRDDPTAPLFPGMVLVAQKPTGVRVTPATDEPDAQDAKRVARRQADALADLSVEEAEARLALKWDEPLRHATFYKAVYRPAVLRANRIAVGTSDRAALLSPELRFHSLRHTFASLCGEAGIPVRQVAEFMGHANPTTTEHIYTHVYKKGDHDDVMSQLGAMAAQPIYADNVVPLRR